MNKNLVAMIVMRQQRV